MYSTSFLKQPKTKKRATVNNVMPLGHYVIWVFGGLIQSKQLTKLLPKRVELGGILTLIATYRISINSCFFSLFHIDILLQ